MGESISHVLDLVVMHHFTVVVGDVVSIVLMTGCAKYSHCLKFVVSKTESTIVRLFYFKIRKRFI